MSSVDPLRIMREYIMDKKTIKLVDNSKVNFGTISLDLTTKTCWVKNAKINSDEIIRYTVGDIWLFLDMVLLKKESIGKYFGSVGQFKIKNSTTPLKMISTNDQKDIKDYFSGKINTCDSINYELTQSSRNRGELLGKRSKPDVAWSMPKNERRGSETEIDEEIKKNLEQIRKWERVLESKNGKLRKNKSFKWCIDLLERKNTSRSDRAPGAKNHRNLLEQVLDIPTSDLEPAKPIIVVPSAYSPGNLNLRNVKQFLVKGEYNPNYEGLTTMARNYEEVKHDINDQRVTFEIYDDIPYLKSSKKIDRVVAIFLTDHKWQFKDSGKTFGEENIAKLLTKIRGYYMTFGDVTINETIKSWNTKTLSISRAARHKDILVKQEFWEDMSKFLTKYRG